MTTEESGMRRKEDLGKHLCPVCGQFEFETFASFDFCEVCGWEDDGVQELYPDEENCANEMSLNQYRKAFQEGKVSFEIEFGSLLKDIKEDEYEDDE